jgi:TonB family protein
MQITKALPLFVSLFLFVATVFARPTPCAYQEPAKQLQNEEKPLTSQQVAELAEAKRLSAETVKLYNQRKYDEALTLAKTALEIRERVLGPDGELVASSLGNLAEVYIAMHKYAEALAMYQRVLPMYEKRFGPTSEKSASVVDSLALLRYIKGDFKEAELFYQRAISIRESVYGPDRPEVAASLYQLAEFYRRRGDYKKAEPLFLRAMAINDKTLPRDDVAAEKVLQRYICFLYEGKSLDEAKKLEHEFFESRREKNPSGTTSAESGSILNGKAISLPRPPYTAEAKLMRASGIVRVQVSIDETGKVIGAKALCGDPVLAKPSVEAALKARFTPTKLSGQPVKVKGIILYDFHAM